MDVHLDDSQANKKPLRESRCLAWRPLSYVKAKYERRDNATCSCRRVVNKVLRGSRRQLLISKKTRRSAMIPKELKDMGFIIVVAGLLIAIVLSLHGLATR